MKKFATRFKTCCAQTRKDTIEDVAGFVETWDTQVNHDYRLSDCIRLKFNQMSKHNIRKNNRRSDFKEEHAIGFLITWKLKSKKPQWGGGFRETLRTRASGERLRIILRALRNDPRIDEVAVWKETTQSEKKKVSISSMPKGR